jgi:hypothetical protein
VQGSLSLLACACLMLVLPAGALPLAGTSGAASLARAEAGSAGRATFKQTVTIELTSLTMIESQHLEPPRDRPRKGDYIAFRDLLLNRHAAQFGKKAGKAVAWDEGIVIYTSATGTKIHVLATFPGLGTISYEGPLFPDAHGDSVVPIIAGSGAFKGARGTVTIGSGRDSSPNTFHLTVPGHPIDVTSGGGAA